jgi:hypothetical protein
LMGCAQAFTRERTTAKKVKKTSRWHINGDE